MENKNYLNVENVNLSTFEESPNIAISLTTVFRKMENEIKARFDEIMAYIIQHDKKHHIANQIAYEDIERNFYELILKEVKGNQNDTKEILDFITEAKVKEAMVGKPMIDAFCEVIQNIPTKDVFDTISHGSMIMFLTSEFLGVSLFEELK